MKVYKFYLLTYSISLIITESIRFVINIQCKKKDREKNQKKFPEKFLKNLQNFFQKVTKGMNINFKDKKPY